LQIIDSKYGVDRVPVQSNTTLGFTQIQNLPYLALLYELRELDGVTTAAVSPNWFGVAIPNPANFDLSSDVYVVLYFHPTPAQAGFDNRDYQDKSGANGTDWKQLYAFVDRLGGQMTAAVQHYAAPANRLVIVPFLKQPSPIYTLATSEWGNIIHDILQDINNNVCNGICTRPKNVILASLSNGSVYLNKFLSDSSTDASNGNESIFSNIVEVWDFDSDVTRPRVLVDPDGKQLRAYWQNSPGPAGSVFVALPGPATWTQFDNPPPVEVPPLPPNPSNSNPTSTPDPPNSVTLFHHYIRDTMFLDAAWKAGNPNA
jgi:hypothetical protein